jgi:sugar lactone lactonase YvrE
MAGVRVALDAKAVLGEGPVWCPREAALYWVDSLAPAVKRFEPATGAAKTWPVPDLIGSFALRESGGLVVALRRGFYTLDLETGATAPVHLPEKPEDTRFNDGKCDRAGRFWAGTMHYQGMPREPKGALYRMDIDRRVTRMERGIRTANGLGWSPDDRRMYYTDTRTNRIDVFDFDIATGAIANRRPFVHVPHDSGLPDGLTVDSEGYVWSAKWDGARVVRYAPDGRIDRVVAMPVPRPTSVSFGGPDLATLFVTSAREGLDAAALARAPHSGAVFAFEPGVQGLPEPRFGG